jgi:hypothetical protein
VALADVVTLRGCAQSNGTASMGSRFQFSSPGDRDRWEHDRTISALTFERLRLMRTLETLSVDQFRRGPTLCDKWSPRDVLAHVIGTDHPQLVLGSAATVNARSIARYQGLSDSSLMDLGWRVAERPSRFGRALGSLLAGDAAVHHRDVVRALKIDSGVGAASAGRIFWEGVNLDFWSARRLLRHRVHPTTAGGRRVGRGRAVRGSSEALGMWLAGRAGIEAELDFDDIRD